jgi:hypothetical protein
VRLTTLAVLIACAPGLEACGGAHLGFQKDGSYVLTTAEQGMACDRLYKDIWGRIQLIKAMPERVQTERKQVSKTAVQAWWRVFGDTGKSETVFKDFDRERTRVEALYASMQEKKCMAVDLERELGPTIVEMEALRQS